MPCTLWTTLGEYLNVYIVCQRAASSYLSRGIVNSEIATDQLILLVLCCLCFSLLLKILLQIFTTKNLFLTLSPTPNQTTENISICQWQSIWLCACLSSTWLHTNTFWAILSPNQNNSGMSKTENEKKAKIHAAPNQSMIETLYAALAHINHQKRLHQNLKQSLLNINNPQSVHDPCHHIPEDQSSPFMVWIRNW